MFIKSDRYEYQRQHKYYEVNWVHYILLIRGKHTPRPRRVHRRSPFFLLEELRSQVFVLPNLCGAILNGADEFFHSLQCLISHQQEMISPQNAVKRRENEKAQKFSKWASNTEHNLNKTLIGLLAIRIRAIAASMKGHPGRIVLSIEQNRSSFFTSIYLPALQEKQSRGDIELGGGKSKCTWKSGVQRISCAFRTHFKEYGATLRKSRNPSCWSSDRLGI